MLDDAAIDGLPIAATGATGVPAIDLAQGPQAISAAVAEACRDWGFFLITGHGIKGELTRRCLDEMRSFFARTAEAKRLLWRTLENPWGYYDRELTKNLRDRKDIFDFGPDDSDPADPFGRTTLWPDGATTFSATMRELMALFETLADRLVRIVMTGLGEPESVVAEAFGPSPTSSCG